MKVLIAEDDALTREGLAEVLRAEGYQVLLAEDGEAALRLFQDEGPDLVCLDIMMPKVNGYDVCRKIRSREPQTPIVFISAKSEEIDKVVGLELGADDFIVKPFGVKEVVARIRAVTRRCRAAARSCEPNSFTMGDLEVFPRELRARRGVPLTAARQHPTEELDRFGRSYGPHVAPSLGLHALTQTPHMCWPTNGIFRNSSSLARQRPRSYSRLSAPMAPAGHASAQARQVPQPPRIGESTGSGASVSTDT